MVLKLLELVQKCVRRSPGVGMAIAHISHDRQDWQWCTFLKPVPLLASITLNIGPFWPFLAILSRFYALFSAPWDGMVKKPLRATTRAFTMLELELAYR